MKYSILITFSALIFFIPVTKAQYNYPNNQGSFATIPPGLLNGASVFTIEFWVKTTETRGNNIYWQRPFLLGNETTGNNSGDFGITTNFGYIGMWEGISSRNDDQQFLSSGVRINDDQWHHIAVVNNGQMISLYVDGNITGSLVSGKRLNTTNAPLTFGAASLNHNFPGNFRGNINFASQAYFGEARVSSGVRYGANFRPSQSFSSDGFTLATYHFDNQNYNPNYNTNTLPGDPNQPVVFDPSQPVNDDAAQPATLYLNDSTSLEGRLFLGKKNFSFNNEIVIHFFEGNSKKVNHYKPDEIKAFRMGDSYYEPRFLGTGGVINTPLNKTMVRRLTPPGSRMSLYEYDLQTVTKNSNGSMEYKTTVLYFVGLPGATDDKVYQFSDNRFTPHFDTRVSAIVQDKPELADKIRNKDKDFFYAFITDSNHQLKVWWNIINEYNK